MKNQYSFGGLAFLIGVAISVLSSFIALPEVALFISGLMGLIVGLSNITMKETQKALLWAIAIGVLGTGSGLASAFAFGKITFISSILTSLGTFFSIVAFVFLIKFGWELLKK